MAYLIFNDPRFYVDGMNLTPDGSEFSIDRKTETHDITTFGKTTRIFQVGLNKESAFSFKGFQNVGVGLLDDTLRQKFAVNGVPILAAADGGDYGERCIFMRTLASAYAPISGKLGDPLMFDISGTSDGYSVVEGLLLEDGKTVRTATGAGAWTLMGAVGATQRFYAIVHLLSINTGTVTITIHSATDALGTDDTVRATFAGQTTVGGLYLVPVGPAAITDTYWGAAWTAAGGANSFAAVVGFAIQ